MRGYQNYARARVDSAPPEDILIMLLDGALDRLRQADEAMAAGNNKLWNKHLHVVRAVFIELSMALDDSMPPAIARNLKATYGWVVHHCIEAGRRGDRERLAEIDKVVHIVHETWVKAIAIQRGDAEPPEGTP